MFLHGWYFSNDAAVEPEAVTIQNCLHVLVTVACIRNKVFFLDVEASVLISNVLESALIF